MQHDHTSSITHSSRLVLSKAVEQDKKCVERRARKKDSIVLNILPASVVGNQAALQLEQAVPGVSRKGLTQLPTVPLATCSTFDQSKGAGYLQYL